MKNILVITALLLAFASISAAQTPADLCRSKCPAGPVYDPVKPCREYCEDSYAIPRLILGTVEEFRYFFNLSKETAEKLVKLNIELLSEGKLPSRELYMQELKEESVNFNQKLESLNNTSFKYLILPLDSEIRSKRQASLVLTYRDLDQRIMRQEINLRKYIQNDIQKDIQKSAKIKPLRR